MNFHHNLGKYFHKQCKVQVSKGQKIISSRIINELPWQLGQAKEYKRLKTYFKNFIFLNLIIKNNEIDAITYWRQLNSHFNMSEEFVSSLKIDSNFNYEEPMEMSDKLFTVSAFLLLVATHEVAEVFLRFGLKFDELNIGSNSINAIRDLSSLALELDRMDRRMEADEIHDRVIDILRSSTPINTINFAQALCNQALHYGTRALEPQAKRCYHEALQILENSNDLENLTYANILCNSSIYDTPFEAIPKLRYALQIAEKIYSNNHIGIVHYLISLAHRLIEVRPNEAEKLAIRALDIYNKNFGKQDRRSVEVLNILAGIYQRSYRISEAESLLRQALTIEIASKSTNQLMYANLLERLAVVLLMTGKKDEAKSLLHQAINILDKDPIYVNEAKRVQGQIVEIE
ncbi:MAG: tetratricopeptide repeat protein [Saprospiraceae bacterium]|nr:tetratricopeptide repeat protein [Saprospiraceae bacterium]